MPTEDYTTTYSGANPTQDADPITGVQPDMDDFTDFVLSSHTETLRDKLQAVAKMIGDSANLPAGSVVDILDRDHANGDARQVRLRKRASDPSSATDIGFIYSKDVSGITELFYMDSAGSVVQLTSGGSLAGGGSSPLTTKGDVYTYDTSDARLPVGTDGQVLKANSATPTGLEWAAESAGDPSPLTTKGDIYVYDTGDARLPVGTDGQFLVADSAEGAGVKWADSIVAAAGARVEVTDGQPVNTIAIAGTDTKILPEDEASISFDVPTTGKYRVSFSFCILVTGGGSATVRASLLFDGATTVGNDATWSARQSNVGDYMFCTFNGEVSLTAGSHTLIGYLREINGDGASVVGSSTVDVTAPKVELVLLSSDAGAVPLTTKGDLFAYSTEPARLPVGTDGQALLADSGEATGLKWSSILPVVTKASVSSQSISGTFSPDAMTTVAGLQLDITTTRANEEVLVMLSGNSLMPTAGVANTHIRALVDDVEEWPASAGPAYLDQQFDRGNLAVTFSHTFATAGAHTIKFAFAKFDSGNSDFTIEHARATAIQWPAG